MSAPRPVLVGLLLLLCLGAAPPAAATAKPGDDRELIMLVLMDAMRPDHMSAYGYPHPTTPNLDVFAKEGVRHTRVYTNAPWTRPSTASFLTGLNASRHRTETESSKLPADVVSLAERLKKRGFVTAGFTANGNGGSLAGLERGFDVFEDPSRTYKKADRGPTYCCNGLPTGEFLVKRLVDWLDKTKNEKKRFVFLFMVDPHDPYGAPPELEKMFLGLVAPDHVGEPRRNALWETKNNYPDAERRSMVALYDAGIRYADQAFGQLVAAMKERGIYDRSTIFVSADHGEGFGEHGFYLHAHHFWEEVVRIPLLVRGPRFSPGVDPRLTQAIDVSATIAALAGLAPTELPGRSLLAPPVAQATVISEYNEFGIHRQMIVGSAPSLTKVVWQRPADEAWFLRTAKKKENFPSVVFDREVISAFDLDKDPGEKNDLGAKLSTEAAALLEQLRRFVDEAGKPGKNG